MIFGGGACAKNRPLFSSPYSHPHPISEAALGEGQQYEKASNTKNFSCSILPLHRKPSQHASESRFYRKCHTDGFSRDGRRPSSQRNRHSEKYRAIYQRLIARRRGRPVSNTRGGYNKKLENPQDHAVQDYLLMLYHAGTSANLEALIVAANRVLFYSGKSSNISQRWAKR
jgi:hypothetical protein